MIKKYTPKEFQARLRRLKSRISKGGELELKNIGKYMVTRAKELAPFKDGYLYKLISSTPTKNKQVWLTQGNPGRINPNYAGKPFNYAEAMRRNNSITRSNWLNNKIRSGDPDYMEKTGKEAKVKFSKDIRVRVNRAIKLSE